VDLGAVFSVGVHDDLATQVHTKGIGFRTFK